MKLVICEKPSVGAAVAAALGVREKKDGYIEGNGYVISWCIGHLVGLAEAAAYGEQYRKWSYDSLPILPQEWQYTVAADKGKQFKILKDLMQRSDVSEVVNACDAGREGELIFRFVYHQAGCKKPFTRLWISSMETDAIKSGFDNLKDGRRYDALYHSALCRAKADWLIGKDGKPVTEEKEITIPAFKVVSVFDVSQTEGKEIPDIAVNMLTGDVEHYKDVFAALEKTSPVPVGFEKIEGGAHGYYHLEDKRIALDEGMSELQTLKTLIHEIAHAKLHDIDLNAPLEDLENRPDRRTREVQAESIAYTVCQHYGLDTSDYSFGYVAGWSAGRELAELKSSLETIRSTAAEIINSIDEHIAELQKEQAQDAPREKAAMQEYIYKIEANPRTTGDNDRFFLQAYLPQENGRAKIGDVLYIGSLAKCRELMGGLNAGELTQGEVKELYAKAQEAEADKDTFSIYQLKQGDETRDFRFEPYDRLQAAGNVVDKTNYELVYSAELTPGTSLEDIYTRFNIDHPKDFKGHSLSVSDVVVLHQNGQDAAHYVDSFGYKEVPEFLQEQTQQPEKINPLKHVEDTIEQNDNNFDGIINNTPTVDELEAKVKAGEQISLVDLAEAIKADKERGKEKPSIRAQLKADKERTGKKKNAKQKSQDLERS